MKETLDKIDINEITAERMLDPEFAARVRVAVARELAEETVSSVAAEPNWRARIEEVL